MGLRRKTTVIISLTLACLLVVLYVAARIIVLGGFVQQEKADTQRDVERVLGVVRDNTAAVAGTTSEWGSWDATYEFVADRNDAYIEENLSSNITFVNNHISLAVYVDRSGEVVYAKAFDLSSEQEIPVPDGLAEHLQAGRLLPTDPDSTAAVTGILALPQFPMLVSAQPILTSNSDGPRRGTVIFGRFLDAAEIALLAKTTLFSIGAYQANSPGLPQHVSTAIAAINDQAPVLVRPTDEKTVSGYTVIKDIYGAAALVLQIDVPREVYARGLDTLLLLLVSLVVVGIVFVVLVLMLLERLVLSRVSQLSSSVDAVGVSNDLSTRVALAGNDELAGLAGNVNSMLDALEHAQQERRESEERYRALVETSPHAIVLSDLDGKIIFCNQQAAILYGCKSVQDLIGRDVYSTFVPEDRRRAQMNIQRTLEQGSVRNVEYTFLKGDGSQFPGEVSASVLSDSEGKPTAFLSITQDITERKVLEKRLSYQAYHDPLTGLSNRALFMDRLTTALPGAGNKADTIGLLFLDLDNFKLVNDSLGHKAGDELLVEVAKRLSQCVRRQDSISRLGGDEFTILVEYPEDISDLTRLAERILERFKEPITLEGQQMTISVSIGIAFSSGNTTPGDLLRFADMAMYEAKRKGKGAYAVFDAKMEAASQPPPANSKTVETQQERSGQGVGHYRSSSPLGGGSMP